jgi:hypothetical protein
MIMTRNKAQKTATRQRMAETGEPYSVARRAAGAGEAGAEDPDFTKITPEERYAREAKAAGVAAAEIEAQTAAFQARERADQVQEAADQAREQADQAEEAANQAEERAELAQEAADVPGRLRHPRPGVTRPPLPPVAPLPPLPPWAPQPPR